MIQIFKIFKIQSLKIFENLKNSNVLANWKLWILVISKIVENVEIWKFREFAFLLFSKLVELSRFWTNWMIYLVFYIINRVICFLQSQSSYSVFHRINWVILIFIYYLTYSVLHKIIRVISFFTDFFTQPVFH